MKIRHIAVDLDGTLAHYDTWKGVEHIGEPIPNMVERVKKALAVGHHVSIFTARVADDHALRDDEVARLYIEEWCLKHIGVRLPVTAVKSGYFTEFWDDRAVRIERNFGVPDVELEDTIYMELSR